MLTNKIIVVPFFILICVLPFLEIDTTTPMELKKFLYHYNLPILLYFFSN